ncbi:DUF742 domain-containing protein [Umezawaea beigongshangensis]|uniref:DUF742 domain-containing protein n=1 Tax=Umezawaea beigongshangensis TaxID=2780383 RepID=UPI0018F20010|nr:DUF742 domain-containing protein [Umezawaea beigongshangensis]
MSSGGPPEHGRRRRDEPAPSEQTFANLLNGFTLDSARRKPRDEPRAPVEQERAHQQEREAAEAWEQADADAEIEAAAAVRAYAWTGGRTTSDLQLEIETLVQAREEGYRPGALVQADHHQVVELCRHPRSVAEVASLLSLPLGVARVLLGDMAAQGLIVVHENAPQEDGTPDMSTMERVLAGLRRL